MVSKAPRALRLFQFFLWGLVLVAVAYLVIPRFLPPPQKAAEVGPGVLLTTPFTLVNQNGATVTQKDFAGTPAAWFYGFTNCPDVCPTALAEMAALLEALGPDADKLNAVFVTVDPERDTQQVMQDYLAYFDPRIIGLTGDLPAVQAMAKSRFIYFAKVPQEDGGYTMDHSAGIYLTNANGEFVGTLDDEEPMEIKLQKVKKLIAAT